MKIRLTKADLLEWLNDMRDDDKALITVRFTTDGTLLSVQVDEALPNWVWREPDKA